MGGQGALRSRRFRLRAIEVSCTTAASTRILETSRYSSGPCIKRQSGLRAAAMMRRVLKRMRVDARAEVKA